MQAGFLQEPRQFHLADDRDIRGQCRLPYWLVGCDSRRHDDQVGRGLHDACSQFIGVSDNLDTVVVFGNVVLVEARDVPAS